MEADDSPAPGILPPEALLHYLEGREHARLFHDGVPLEFVRTRELLLRSLPPAPAVVLDVGGGPGAYACWLAELGYTVHLVDAVPLHVEQAAAASATEPAHPLASATVGDARTLNRPDASVDAVLLGPLYHLTERGERVQALSEAHRVVRPGGVVFAVAISRFTSLLGGLVDGELAVPAFLAIVERDVRDGQHRTPPELPYFTTSFFHHPAELEAEVRDAGLELLDTVAFEGPMWLLKDAASWWGDTDRRERLLALLRVVEREPTLLGLSTHILCVGRRRSDDAARAEEA
jgi:ubiquinone/menaquinone biosynthesis C-methylase UbiE